MMSAWATAINLFVATGKDDYRSEIFRMAPIMLTSSMFGNSGYLACNIIDMINDKGFTEMVRNAVQTFKSSTDQSLAEFPYKVPQTYGMWGGSAGVANLGSQMYVIHKAFPDIVDTSYTLRAVYYTLGVHPFDNISWVTGVGVKSTIHAYQNNRADGGMIPGAPVPGYVMIQPDVPESSSSFHYYWFDSEATIGGAASWLLVAQCALACVAE
jgi:hypothetical protein